MAVALSRVQGSAGDNAIGVLEKLLKGKGVNG
jgi:hypothetical protein